MIARRSGTYNRNSEGFTLIELMVVVLVIAILLAIAIPTFLGARSRSQDTAAKSAARIALEAAQAIAAGAAGSYATADAAGMATEEPSLTYVATASTGPKVVSVSASATSWGAAVLSAAGTCFGVKADVSGVVTYAHTTGGCTGSTMQIVASSTTPWTSATTTAYQASVQAMSGLQGYWTLDESSGTSVADSSGNSRTGTAIASPSMGTSGLIANDSRTAFTFNNPSYVALPAMGSLTQFTMNAWVRTPSSIAYHTITAGSTFRWNVHPGCSSQYVLALEMTGGSGGSISSSCFAPNTLVMVSVTNSGSTSTVYVNGVAVGTSATGQTINLNAARIGLDGVSNIGSPDAFNGVVDEVSVWNRALTPTELTTLYAAGS